MTISDVNMSSEPVVIGGAVSAAAIAVLQVVAIVVGIDATLQAALTIAIGTVTTALVTIWQRGKVSSPDTVAATTAKG